MLTLTFWINYLNYKSILSFLKEELKFIKRLQEESEKASSGFERMTIIHVPPTHAPNM